MKGFFGLKGIILLAAFLLLFGGAFYDLTTTAGRCGLSVTNPELDYSCDEMYTTVGKILVMPDRNVATGITGVKTMQNVSDETLTEIGVLRDTQSKQYQQLILLGLIGWIVLLGLFSYIFIKLSPASGIDAGSLAIAIFAAFLVMAAFSAICDDTPEHGHLAIFGERTPFKGLRLLLANPDVLGGVVDETSLLPGTLTVDDIVNGTGES